MIWSGAFCLDSQFQLPKGELENDEVDVFGDLKSHRTIGRRGLSCLYRLVSSLSQALEGNLEVFEEGTTKACCFTPLECRV